MEEFYAAATSLMQFIQQYWWVILVTIYLLKFRRTGGIIMCGLHILWTYIPINEKLYVFFTLAILIGSLFEQDNSGKNINNITIPPGINTIVRRKSEDE